MYGLRKGRNKMNKKLLQIEENARLLTSQEGCILGVYIKYPDYQYLLGLAKKREGASTEDLELEIKRLREEVDSYRRIVDYLRNYVRTMEESKINNGGDSYANA